MREANLVGPNNCVKKNDRPSSPKMDLGQALKHLDISSPRQQHLKTNAQMFKSSSFDESPAPSPTSSSNTSGIQSSTSEIFTIHKPTKPEFGSPAVHTSVSSETLTHHSFLDVRPLSVEEKLHLARIHYVTIPNGIRLAILIFCLAWCGYISMNTFNEFKDHETIVHLDYLNPSIGMPPAITVCTHCILCQFHERIKEIEVMSIFEKDLASLKQAGKTVLPGKPIGQKATDVDINCTIAFKTIPAAESSNQVDCTSLVPVVKSLQEGRKCFTYFSDMFGQVSKALSHSENSSLLLQFDQFPHIYIQVGGLFVFGIAVEDLSNTNPTTKTSTNQANSAADSDEKAFTGISINLHDPTVIPGMYDMAFHQVVPGKTTYVPYVKRVQHLLPAPFKTECYDYNPNQAGIKERFESRVLTQSKVPITSEGLDIYHSRGECFLHCMWRLLNTKQSSECVNFFSIYTDDMVVNENSANVHGYLEALRKLAGLVPNDTIHIKNSTFCLKTDDAFAQYIKAKHQCLSACPEACLVETYSEEDMYDAVDDPRLAKINIQWAPKPIINIVHRPKLDTPEFLGTLGGQAHIWLGISAIHIIWYVVKTIRSMEILPDTSCCAIIHCWAWTRRRKV